MTLRGTVRILLSKWYVVVAGMLFSVLFGVVVFTAVPAQYTSTGLAVLVQPRLTERGPYTNPLLNFDPSLSTTALVIVQSLDTPGAAEQAGVMSKAESYTVEQAGTDVGGTTGQVVQPFISVKTKASSAARSTELVDAVLGLARQELVDQQKDLRVLPQKFIRLQDLGYTSVPTPVRALKFAATGAALLLGFCLTFGLALLLHRWEASRKAKRSRSSVPARRTPEPRVVLGVEAFVVSTDGNGSSMANGTSFGPPVQLQG